MILSWLRRLRENLRKYMSNNNSDLFEFFNRMNAGDLQYVDNMSDEEVKKLSPYVLLMWNASDKAARPIHTLSVAHAVADKVFTLSKHPRLLLKLFISANCNISKTRYVFNKQAKAPAAPEDICISKFYNVTLSDALEYKNCLNKTEIEQILSLYQKD